mmetsp:Transcript_111358/g.265666  ORF Transcript_111358/g.265666 Transcript_111358/m.265666 type:complete len:414 (+) Transcript_111358:237-1478(+)
MVSSGNMGDSSSNLGHLEELFLGVNADRLGCSGCRNVSSSHLAIHQEALAQALLCKRNDLVHGGCGHLKELRQAASEAQACGHILGQVAVLQVRHEAAVRSIHGMGEPDVGTVGVHGQLQSGVIRHLPLVGVQVPLVQSAGILQIKAGHHGFHLAAHILHLPGQAQQHPLREVIHTLVEERLLRQGLAIPLLSAPAPIHDTRVDHLARVPEADAQVVRTLQHLWVHAKKALELSEGLLRCRHGGHGCKNVVLSAEDGGLLAPLREAACPGQCLEAAEDHVLGLVPKLGGEQDVAAGARGHRGHDGARLHVGRELLEVLAMCEGWNHKQDQVSILGDGGVVGDVLGLRLHDSTTWGCELELRITQGILPLCGLIGEEGHGDGLVPHCKEARGDLRSIPAAAAQDRELCIASAHG